MANILAVVGIRRLRALAALVGAAALLGGCASSAPAAAGGVGRTATAAPLALPPAITISPADGSRGIRIDSPISVSADRGKLDTVVFHSDADPTPLPGVLAPDHRQWTSTAGLDPASHYVVEASAHDEAGSSTAHAAFGTMPTPRRLLTDVSPGDGETVGVGMPIMLSFHSDIAPDRQAGVLQHIAVQTSVPVEGAWHWFTPSEAHWRPKDFWPAGTKVTVVANLRDVDAGNGRWGLGNWTSTFAVGEKHLSMIDAAAHAMNVYASDRLIHTYPVSTGRPDRPTLSGMLFVRGKVPTIKMDSQTIGIPRDAPDGYYQDVLWDTAISVNGFFIHAAPWSVAQQGVANVSHGCVNLSPERAAEFYNFSQTGDLVQVLNTTRVADYGDGEGDWQIPWAQWANTSAAPAAPSPSNAPGGA